MLRQAKKEALKPKFENQSSKAATIAKSKSQEPKAKNQKTILDLSPISIRQQLSQAGFVLIFFVVLLVFRALHWRRRPQHGP